MIKFRKEIHDKFKQKFKIKENPSKIDLFFLKKAQKYINYIRWIPGIKMIGVGNSISMNAGTSESDIDLFIVTSTNRIWFVRILITLIFQILGVRKNNKIHSGRFCLSFFATEKALDFSKFALKNDVYLYFWIVYFKPILDFDNTYDKFIKTNETWADFSEYKNILELNKKSRKIIGKSFGNNCIIINLIEKILKKIFLKRTLKKYEKLGKPFGVIINNDMLKFHDKDIRKKIKEELIL